VTQTHIDPVTGKPQPWRENRETQFGNDDETHISPPPEQEEEE